MTKPEEQYFALLRAAIWDQPVAIEGKIDWHDVMVLAEHHATQVLLYDLALRLPENQQPEADALNRMKKQLRVNLVYHLRMRQTLLQAVALLRERNIEPVLLKGFGLAQFYPNPNLRQFGDIDLFVGLDNFHEACSTLRAMPDSYNWSQEVDLGKHYNLEFGDYAMEIHRVSADVSELEERDAYMEMERQGLLLHPQLTEVEGTMLTIPSKNFMVLFTFYHAWEHFLTTGVGWRQMCDIALALHAYSGQLDLEQFRKDLTALHLMQPWQAFGKLFVDCLGLPEFEMPFYKASMGRTASKLYRHIMDEGNFKRQRKFKRKPPKQYWIKKVQSFISLIIDFFRLSKLFPSLAFRQLCGSIKQGLTKTESEISQSGKKIHTKREKKSD